MSFKTGYIFVIASVLMLVAIGLLIFRRYQMSTYEDLVHFKQEIEHGDIIFRCEYSGELRQTTDFNEYGIIEKSRGKIYVWDNRNTMKKSLRKWIEEANGGHVKVFRVKVAGFDIKNVEKKNGTYNYLMDSGQLEFVTGNCY